MKKHSFIRFFAFKRNIWVVFNYYYYDDSFLRALFHFSFLTLKNDIFLKQFEQSVSVEKKKRKMIIFFSIQTSKTIEVFMESIVDIFLPGVCF